MTTDPLPDVVRLAPESVQRGLDNPLPKAPRKRRKPKPETLNGEVTVKAAHPGNWKLAKELAHKGGLPPRNLVIEDDGSVLILNTRKGR